MQTSINAVSMAEAKQILSDKKIDNKEATSLGLNKKEAEELSQALQSKTLTEKTALEKLMQEGHIRELPNDDGSFIGNLLRNSKIYLQNKFLN